MGIILSQDKNCTKALGLLLLGLVVRHCSATAKCLRGAQELVDLSCKLSAFPLAESIPSVLSSLR